MTDTPDDQPPTTPPAEPGGKPSWFVSEEAPPGWGLTPPPASSAAPGPRRPRRWTVMLAAALVGALVGAGSATAIYLATDDDAATPEAAVVVRPAADVETPGNIPEILARVQPATVSIHVTGDLGAECGRDIPPGQEAEGAGSGFVISEDGFVVTNSHVVGGANEINVELANGETHAAEIIGRDAAADLAVLKIDATELPTVDLGDSDEVVVGDAAIVIGNALGLRGTPSVTSGIVSALERNVPTPCGILENALQTDAAINSGNSGGPVVDARGRVIGIATAIADPSVAQNVGFAIGISFARPIIEALREGRLPAFLGVETRTVDEVLQAELGLAVGSGALIVNVTLESPAATAGLQPEDVIVRIGDQEISTSRDVVAGVRAHEPGDEVEVVVNRAGEEVSVTVVLAQRPDAN
jgi:serine protease DegQ